MSKYLNEFKRCVSILKKWHEYISNYSKYNYSNGPTMRIPQKSNRKIFCYFLCGPNLF